VVSYNTKAYHLFAGNPVLFYTPIQFICLAIIQKHHLFWINSFFCLYLVEGKKAISIYIPKNRSLRQYRLPVKNLSRIQDIVRVKDSFDLFHQFDLNVVKLHR